jgi:hypothetical protein
LNAFDDQIRLKRREGILGEFYLHGPLIVIVQQKEPAIVFALVLNVDDVRDRSQKAENGLEVNLLLGKEVEVFRVPMPEVKRRQRRSAGQVKMLTQPGIPKA